MKRVVVKVGSSTLVKPDGAIDASFIDGLTADCAQLIAEDEAQPIIVTSGSIALGLGLLGIDGERPDDMPTLQAAAAIGQVSLISHYREAFASFGISVGQLLLTRATTGERDAYLHACDTLERLMSLRIVPIVNENDGLYTADPRKDADAELLETVSKLSAEIEAGAGGVGSRNGSGGMLTKLAAARVLMASAIPMVICDGHIPHAVRDAVHGKHVGTTFFDAKTAGLHARKSWIALGGKVKGRVVCDDGACAALRERGSSLLPVGIVTVEGDFAAKDAVELVDTCGRLVGRGLAGWDAEDLRSKLGTRGCGEFINRDELVVF